MGERLAVRRWNEATGKRDLDVEVETPRKVFTVRDLHHSLSDLIENYPHLADIPVHVMDMDFADDPADERVWSGLLTDIETDQYDDDQGLVYSLTSWPNKPDRPAPIPNDTEQENDGE